MTKKRKVYRCYECGAGNPDDWCGGCGHKALKPKKRKGITGKGRRTYWVDARDIHGGFFVLKNGIIYDMIDLLRKVDLKIELFRPERNKKEKGAEA